MCKSARKDPPKSRSVAWSAGWTSMDTTRKYGWACCGRFLWKLKLPTSYGNGLMAPNYILFVISNDESYSPFSA